MKRSFDLAVLVAVLAAFLLLNLLLLGRAADVARRTEVVPIPSTWRTTPTGMKALYTLLDRLGYTVDRHERTLETIPDDVTVIVMPEPEVLVTETEALALRYWVDQGGTLVLATQGVRDPESAVRVLPETLFLRDPQRGEARLEAIEAAIDSAAAPYLDPADGLLRWRAGYTNAYLRGVAELALDPDASAVPAPVALRRAIAELSDGVYEWPVAGSDPTWICTLTTIGAGRIFLLPTPALFVNGQLDRADNAVFAVNLIATHAGDGRILFDEYHLGNIGAATTWDLLWQGTNRWVTLQVALALLVLGLRAATRFGPAVPDTEEPARRPATEYVTAIAGLYRRAGATPRVARQWERATRRELARAVGLPIDAAPERLASRVAQRSGLDEAEVSARLRRLAEAASAERVSERRLMELAREADELVRRVHRRDQGSGD